MHVRDGPGNLVPKFHRLIRVNRNQPQYLSSLFFYFSGNGCSVCHISDRDWLRFRANSRRRQETETVLFKVCIGKTDACNRPVPRMVAIWTRIKC